MVKELSIKKPDIEKIFAHCKDAVPNEACGLVFGRDGNVAKVYPVKNADNSPVTYLLDVKEQFKAIMEARKNGEDMLGIFHSHVKSEPYPSETDKRLAYYPEVAYIIVSLMNEEPEIKAYNIVDSEISDVELKVI